MIKKKIVMLGAFAVGKTSLVQRYVKSIFSEKYHTTIGVKIDRKEIEVDGNTVNLLLWDIHGEDEFQEVKKTYIIGASGYLLVADGTRKHTLSSTDYLHDLAENTIGDAPFILLINKTDLEEDWELDEKIIEEIRARGWEVMLTSAKTGDRVEEAFKLLAKKMIEKSDENS